MAVPGTRMNDSTSQTMMADKRYTPQRMFSNSRGPLFRPARAGNSPRARRAG